MEVGNAFKKFTRMIITMKLSHYHKQPALYGKIFLIKTIKAFEGSFSTECQDTFPSPSLKLFICCCKVLP